MPPRLECSGYLKLMCIHCADMHLGITVPVPLSRLSSCTLLCRPYSVSLWPGWPHFWFSS